MVSSLTEVVRVDGVADLVGPAHTNSQLGTVFLSSSSGHHADVGGAGVVLDLLQAGGALSHLLMLVSHREPENNKNYFTRCGALNQNMIQIL